jgi:adenosine deaminase
VKSRKACSIFCAPWVNVETALELLEVERVDHGYTVLENPD